MSYTEHFHLLFTIIFKSKENLDNNIIEKPQKRCIVISQIIKVVKRKPNKYLDGQYFDTKQYRNVNSHKQYRNILLIIVVRMQTSNLDKLETLKMNIESLNKFHQIEILKILSKRLCKLNENKSGVYVNMSFLPDDILEELNKYIEYVNDQTETFVTAEYQKNEFKSSFFVEKEDKDNATIHHSTYTR